MNRRPQTFALAACALAAAMMLSACGGGEATSPDTVAPTVTVTSSAAGTTATGAVTFTFAFSEDVGTSFTAEDIVVNGGAAGAFTMVSNTQYTLVVTPSVGATGTLAVSVSAAKFSDVANNANVVAAAVDQAYNTVVASAGGSTSTCTAAPCIGFEAANVGLLAFEGLGSAEVVADPVDPTNKVARLVKVPSGQPWAGATIYTSNATTQAVDAVGFATSKVITLRVYSPAVGEKIMLKVETGPQEGGMEKEVLTTKANEWETLSFDFGAPTAGTYDASKVYKTISVFPKFLSAVSADTSFYFDELKYAASTVVAQACGTTAPTCAPTTAVPSDALSIYTDAANAAGFNARPDWGQSVVYSEETIAGNKSLKYTFQAGGFGTAGAFEGIEWAAVNVSAKGKLHLELWSADMSSVKVSLISAGKENAYTQAITQGSWNSVDIDLSNFPVADKTAIIQIKLESATAGTLYVDNIHFWGAAGAAGGGAVGGTPNPDAAPGSAGAVTIPVLTAADSMGFAGAGDAVFAADYIGPIDSNGNHALWTGATSNGLASNGNIGYFQDAALSASVQKLEENGWVASVLDNPGGVPSLFRYFILTEPGSAFASSYMGLFVNAPNNGTVNVSSYGSIKFRAWGPAEMYQQNNFNPTLEMTLAGARVAGCTTTGSGGTEIKKSFVADQKIGAASTYKLPLAAWTVVGVCGTDTAQTAVASVLGALARVVVTVPGSSFNFTNANAGSTPVTYATGVNLGPIAFTNQ